MLQIIEDGFAFAFDVVDKAVPGSARLYVKIKIALFPLLLFFLLSLSSSFFFFSFFSTTQLLTL